MPAAPRAQAIYDGYFDDDQVKDRPLSDYAGDWQSVYPQLQDGTLARSWTARPRRATRPPRNTPAYYQTRLCHRYGPHHHRG